MQHQLIWYNEYLISQQLVKFVAYHKSLLNAELQQQTPFCRVMLSLVLGHSFVIQNKLDNIELR